MFGSTPERGVLTQCYLKPYTFQIKQPSFNVPCTFLLFPISHQKNFTASVISHLISLFAPQLTISIGTSPQRALCAISSVNKPPLPQTITIEIFADHHDFDHGFQQFNVWVQ
jgi:hypothetical protein